MKKFNKAIYLFADTPILKTEEINSDRIKIEGLSPLDTVYLNSLLYSNWIEILSKQTSDQFDVYYFIDKRDEEFLPKNFLPEGSNLIFTDSSAQSSVWNELQTKYFQSYPNNLLISYNSIGIRTGEIKKIFDLLLIEDTALVIGKSGRDKIIFLGFNKISEKIFDGFYSQLIGYHEYLSHISSKDYYIHVLEGFLSVNDLNDFKKLYIELSKKESLSYCCEKIHERFNDLFIEYKELLNE
jgi:hypothetical protein